MWDTTFSAHIIYVKNHSTLCGAALIDFDKLIAPSSCVPDEISLSDYTVHFKPKGVNMVSRGIIRKNVYHEDQVNFVILHVSNFKFLLNGSYFP